MFLECLCVIQFWIISAPGVARVHGLDVLFKGLLWVPRCLFEIGITRFTKIVHSKRFHQVVQPQMMSNQNAIRGWVLAPWQIHHVTLPILSEFVVHVFLDTLFDYTQLCVNILLRKQSCCLQGFDNIRGTSKSNRNGVDSRLFPGFETSEFNGCHGGSNDIGKCCTGIVQGPSLVDSGNQKDPHVQFESTLHDCLVPMRALRIGCSLGMIASEVMTM
mmetsp:Transcript_14379/g.33207  ORF Transcript_14379/g.33207 Transcript_14379/m.33207 type:complete len:217 (-) Transcript_14379:672-1322(-)